MRARWWWIAAIAFDVPQAVFKNSESLRLAGKEGDI